MSSKRGADDRDEKADGRYLEPNDQRPYLCIPYWTTPLADATPPDDGQVRPLPNETSSGVQVSLCPGIDGGYFFTRFEPHLVSVVVRNTGGGNGDALAMVRLWWIAHQRGRDQLAVSDLTHATFLGFEQIAVPPRGGTGATRFFSLQVPDAESIPGISLIACVSHFLDKAPPPTDPIGSDRHWAQRHLLLAVQ